MPEPTVPAPRQPDLQDVLVVCEALRQKLAEMGERVQLAVPHPRNQTCTRLVAVLSDLVDLLEDVVAGP
jgi:hypothetical protein